MIAVSTAMEAAIEAEVQRPKHKLLSYDISSDTGETWGSIITGASVQTPQDLTPFLADVQWSFDRLNFTLVDDQFQFHPDTGSLRKMIAPGRGIRFIEGAEGVPENEWVPTFSGIIQGPYGWKIERGTSSTASVSAFPRHANQAWQRRRITSREYTIGTDWSIMFSDIATQLMNMDQEEVNVSIPWNLSFDKTVNQIVDLPPWEALSSLAQGNFHRLWFNGQGQLSHYPITLDRITLRLADSKIINSYSQGNSNGEVINKVIVTYIDNVLTRVDGAKQQLGTANITTGFFDFETKIDTFWSEDKRQRADQVELLVKQSINQNDLGISIGSERLDIIDEQRGQIVVTVDTFVSALAVAGIAAVLSASFLPDQVQVGPSGSGVTIPVGQPVFAAGIIAVLLAMMILGTGVYEINGVPFDYAFLEKQAIAMLCELEFWEEKELNIRNDFVSTQARADEFAVTELLYNISLGAPRTLVVQNDVRYEPGDILELPGGVKFFIQKAAKRIRRGQVGAITLTGFRTII